MAATTRTVHAILLALILVWFGWLSPSHSIAPWLGLLIAAGPLALIAYPLWRGSRMAYGWTGFLTLGYMTHGLTEAVANPTDRMLATTEAVLAIALFLSVSAALRQRAAR